MNDIIVNLEAIFANQVNPIELPYIKLVNDYVLLNPFVSLTYVIISFAPLPFCIPCLLINHSKLILIKFSYACFIYVISSRASLVIKLCYFHKFIQNLPFANTFDDYTLSDLSTHLGYV